MKKMSDVQVLQVRMDNAENDIKRHEILIERLTENQGAFTKGLAEVTVELKVTNELLTKSMGMQQKLILGLMALVASALGIGTQVM